MILNLTQHEATPEQIAAGVREPHHLTRARIRALLTFDEVPSSSEIVTRANELAEIASAYGYLWAMIGGAPYLMSALESALRERDIEPVYAFSLRESAETTAPDGGIVKRSIFRHAGFIGFDPNLARERYGDDAEFFLLENDADEVQRIFADY